MLWINSEISFVDCADFSANLRTSSATTAKPRPCSPAREASIAAFSASRLVCSAISWMVETRSEMRPEAPARWAHPRSPPVHEVAQLPQPLDRLAHGRPILAGDAPRLAA